MKKLTTIRLVRLSVWHDRNAEEQPVPTCAEDSSEELDLWHRPHHDERPVVICTDEAIDRKPLPPPASDTSTEASLVLNETDQINLWARLGSHLYFGLFAVLLVVNGVALVWLSSFNRASGFFMFIVLDLIGALATILVVKYLLECDRRIEELIEILSKHHETKDSWYKPKSAIPLQQIKILFGFAAFALVVLLIFWTVLFVTAG
jgi:hypothetical protein